MHIQLDPLGGIAGDMFIAAVLDARPELTRDTEACIRAAGVAPDWELAVVEHNDGTFSGSRFIVRHPGRTDGAHHHHYADIVDRLRAASIDADVRDRALAIFELLAHAEAGIHGVSVGEVAFHEVGAWDSVADVVGAAFLIDKLAPRSWSLGTLPLGAGRINTAHGPMPVPAPATARLLQGFPMVDDGIGGERVTPTGAAILRHLADDLGMPGATRFQPMILGQSGFGFGSQSLPGISNLCRIMLFDRDDVVQADDEVGVIQFEIDDQSAEDLAIGVDELRATSGVLDVLQIPAIGKKGRMVCHLQILCRPEALDSVIETSFAQTTTIGLRWNVVPRKVLDRTSVMEDGVDGPVAVKLASHPDGAISAKAEAETIRGRGDRLERERARRKAEEEVLQKLTREKP